MKGIVEFLRGISCISVPLNLPALITISFRDFGAWKDDISLLDNDLQPISQQPTQGY